MKKINTLPKGQDEIINQNMDQVVSNINDFEDVEVITPTTANTDFVISHGLKRVLRGVMVLKQDRAGSIYFSTNATGYFGTELTHVRLRASVASMRIKLRLE